MMKQHVSTYTAHRREKRFQLFLIVTFTVLSMIIMGVFLGCIYLWGQQQIERTADYYQNPTNAGRMTDGQSNTGEREELRRLHISQTVLLVCSMVFFLLVAGGLTFYIARQLRDEQRLMHFYQDLTGQQEQLHHTQKKLHGHISTLQANNEQLQGKLGTVSEERRILRESVERLPFPFYVVERHQKKLLYANNSARQSQMTTTDYSLVMKDRMTENDGAGLSRSMEHVIETRTAGKTEVSHRNGDGTERFYEIHTMPLLADDEVVEVAEAIVDITDRKRQESALQEARAELEGMGRDLERQRQEQEQARQDWQAKEKTLQEDNQDLRLRCGQFDEQCRELQENINKLKHSGQALKAANQQLVAQELHWRQESGRIQKIFHNLIGMTMLIDHQGIILDCNSPGRFWPEQSTASLKNTRIMDLIPIESHHSLMASLEEMFKTGKAFRQHFVLSQGREKRLEVELTCKPLDNEQSAPQEALICLYDITAHRTLGRQLARQAEQKALILDSLLEHIVYHDMDHRIVWVNKAAADFVRKSPEELAGKYCYAVLGDQDEPCAGCPVDLVLAHGKPAVGEPQTSDGRIWRVSSQPVRTEDGRLVGAVAVTVDITQQKQAHQKLIDYQEHLRRLASQLSVAAENEQQRIATQLHDQISQTLGLAKMNLDTLQGLAPTSECAASITEIGQMLDQALYDTRTLTFELGSPILHEFGLEAALEELLEQRFRDLTVVETHFHDDRYPKPLSEDLRVVLYQIVRELLVNIVKHAQATEVHLSVVRQHEMISITVQDNGIGFEEIPEPDIVRNSGFGLFGIRERLSHLGGHVEIESACGEGTRVCISAPLATASETVEGET